MGRAMKLQMELPRIPDIELVALEGLDRLGRHMGIAEEKIGEARILVTEALINALEHSGEEHPKVRVEFTITAEELVIFVRDFGEGFEPGSVEHPEIAEKITSANKRGWGLKLMKTLSDDFKIQSGPKGTKIILKKRLS